MSNMIQQSSPSWKWWPHAGKRDLRNGDLLPSNTSGPGLEGGPSILAEIEVIIRISMSEKQGQKFKASKDDLVWVGPSLFEWDTVFLSGTQSLWAAGPSLLEWDPRMVDRCIPMTYDLTFWGKVFQNFPILVFVYFLESRLLIVITRVVVLWIRRRSSLLLLDTLQNRWVGGNICPIQSTWATAIDDLQ